MTPTRKMRPTHRAFSEAPEEVARKLRHLDGFVFLDSASEPAGAISVVTALPEQVFSGHISRPAPLCRALEAMASADEEGCDWGIPVGGLFGSVDFDGSYYFGSYHHALIFDHGTRGWTEVGDTLSGHLERLKNRPAPQFRADRSGSCANSPAPRFESDMEAEAFCQRVRIAQEYIATGDIYQVNLAHRFRAMWPEGRDAFHFYQRLRERSPAPMGAFIDLGGRQIASASPETFLQMSGRWVRTRPIKGTRPRFPGDEARDKLSAMELQRSDKETAELVMITDLERNDLGQVCDFGSVRVPEMLRLEAFEQVYHLVSTVDGTLREDVDHVEALRRCFPGGSISGAPKKRSLEIISELEPIPRGLYTGAIGYFGANGESQFNIAIRTAVAEGGEMHFHAGAGIVADSDPEKEWEETLHKAAGILSAAE